MTSKVKRERSDSFTYDASASGLLTHRAPNADLVHLYSRFKLLHWSFMSNLQHVPGDIFNPDCSVCNSLTPRSKSVSAGLSLKSAQLDADDSACIVLLGMLYSVVSSGQHKRTCWCNTGRIPLSTLLCEILPASAESPLGRTAYIIKHSWFGRQNSDSPDLAGRSQQAADDGRTGTSISLCSLEQDWTTTYAAAELTMYQ